MNASTKPDCQLPTSVVTVALIMMTLLSLSLSASSLAASEASSVDEVVVIVPSDSKVESLTATGLRSIFGMRSRTWPQGEAIKVFVLEDDDPIHAIFSKQILQTFPFNLRRIWNRRIYSGTGQSPQVVKTEAEMHDYISRTENSIGYISRKRLDAGVKVVNLQ